MATSTERPAAATARFTCLVFLAVFALYLTTLSRGIQPGDGPELTTSALHLGICHPSGYPLYTLLGRLFSLLPVGSIAFRLNLFGALCGAAAVAVLAGWIRRVSGNVVGALFAAASLATSVTLWRESVSAEVYSLTALFLALLIVVSPEKRGETRRLFLTAFLGGLALTNHLSLAFLLPVLLLRILTVARPSWRELAACVFLFALGLSPYLYLPIRASLHPLWNWGDPSDIDRLITHVTGMGYWGYLGEGHIGRRLMQWVGGLGRELTWISFLLVPAGLLQMKESRRDLIALVVGGALLSLGYTLHFQINDPDAYFLPVYLLFAVPIAFAFTPIKRTAALPLLVLLPAIQVWQNLPECDLRERDVLGEYVDNLLLTLDEGAALIVEGDSDSFGLLYARHAEGKRPDITLWNAVLDLMPGGPLFDDISRRGRSANRKREAFRAHLMRGGSVYAVSDRDELGVEGYELIPWGLIYRYVPQGSRPPEGRAQLWERYATGEMERVPRNGGYLPRILAATYPLQKSRFHLAMGEEEEAFQLLRQVEVMGEGLSVVWNNVGLAWWRAGRPDEARRLYEKAAAVGNEGLPRLNLALLSMEEEKLDEAEEYFTWVVANDPRLRYDALISVARLTSDRGRYDDARDHYRSAANERPWEAAPHAGLAAISLAEGNYAAARSHYATADRLSPGIARSGEFAIVRAMRDKGRLGEAVVACSVLADGPPRDRDALELLAELRAGQGLHQAADSLYECVLDFNRADPYSFNSFAWSLAERGRDLNRALALAREGRRLAPADPYIADTEGWVLFKMGRYEEAADRFREANALGFEGQGVNYRLGFALRAAGDGEGASSHLRIALEGDPESIYADRARDIIDNSR